MLSLERISQVQLIFFNLIHHPGILRQERRWCALCHVEIQMVDPGISWLKIKSCDYVTAFVNCFLNISQKSILPIACLAYNWRNKRRAI